jgi:hypothetical protein
MVGVILCAAAGIWLTYTGGAFLTLAYDKKMRKGYSFLRLGLGIVTIVAALRLAWGHGSF